MNIKGTILFFLIISFNLTNSQEYQPFKSGEWLKYKISYSGWLKAGEATMQLNKDTIDNKELFHAVAVGRTIGPINWFFKVNDRYESYFDVRDTRPYKFIRKISEGGYTKNLLIYFDHELKKAVINNKKTNKIQEANIKFNSHDLISIIYHLRKNFDF